MNTKEELTKLLMESYDRGVADAKQAAMETFAIAINAAVRVEREVSADIAENWNSNGMPRTGVANEIRKRGQS